MNQYITWAEGISLAGLDPSKARRAALVLRAGGQPVTVDGYMIPEGLNFLAYHLETHSAAYEAAERALKMEEQDRDNDSDDRFTLPQDSRISSATIARRAARNLAGAATMAA